MRGGQEDHQVPSEVENVELAFQSLKAVLENIF